LVEYCYVGNDYVGLLSDDIAVVAAMMVQQTEEIQMKAKGKN